MATMEHKKYMIKEIEDSEKEIRFYETESVAFHNNNGNESPNNDYLSKAKKRKKFNIYCHNFNIVKAEEVHSKIQELDLKIFESIETQMETGNLRVIGINTEEEYADEAITSDNRNTAGYLRICSLYKEFYETRKLILENIKFMERIKQEVENASSSSSS